MFSIDFDTSSEFAASISKAFSLEISIVNHDGKIICGNIDPLILDNYSASLLTEMQTADKALYSYYNEYTVIPVFHITTLICYIFVHSRNPCFDIPNIIYIKTAFNITYENYIMRISKFHHVDRGILISKIVSSKSRIVSYDGYYDATLIKELLNNHGYDSTLERAACLIQFPFVHTMEYEGDAYYDYVFSNAMKKVLYHSSQDIYGMLDNDKLIVLKTVDCEPDEDSRDFLLSYAEDIAKSIYKNNDIMIKVGIGTTFSDFSELQSSFDEANSMIETLYGSSNKNSVAIIEDNIGKYILSDTATSELGEYFSLLSDKLDNNPILLQTITSMSNNDMDLIKTASSLGIHRNTVSMRLEKIKSILGIDPLKLSKDRSLFYLFSLFLESRITLRLGTNTQKTNALYVGCIEFARLVREMSDNKINISIYTAADVAYKRQMAEALKVGTLDFALCSMYHMSEYTNGTSQVLNLPFLFKNDMHAEKALDGLPGRKIAEEMEKQGIISLGYLTQGWRILSNDRLRVRIPEDIKGMKIRIRDNSIMEECIKAFGANPVKSEYGDLLTALKQNIIDGQDNPYINFYSMGYGNYQRYITETNHNYDVIVMAASYSSLSKLTVDQRNIITEAAKLALKLERDEVHKMNSQAKNLLIAEGKIQVEELTDEERNLWIKKVEHLHKNFEHVNLLKAVNDLI